MRWLKWIWAYLFDCVHPHTTWPHRNRTGFVYVCCLDCGKELPYSLELMRIVNPDDHAQDSVIKPFPAHGPASAVFLFVCLSLLLNPSRAIAQRSDSRASQVQPAAFTVAETAPTLVIGFVGGRVRCDDLRHSEVQLARRLHNEYGDRVIVQVFRNRDRAKAHRAIDEWLYASKTAGVSAPRLILFGHSWGASAVVYLARELEQDGVSVALTIQVDSVRKHGQDDAIIPANVAEAINFYQAKGIIHGRTEIVADDPNRTAVLGNFRLEYKEEPAECRAYPWYDRLFFKGHTSIECDPRVWSRIHGLIVTRIVPPLHQPAPTEVAAQLVK